MKNTLTGAVFFFELLEKNVLPQTDDDPDFTFQLDVMSPYFGCIVHESLDSHFLGKMD
jgi:hypothetical protein